LLYKSLCNVLLSYIIKEMTKTLKLITANIQRLRELKGVSQKEVAAAMGIPQSQYSRIENGKGEPTITSLEKLAKALDTSITEFFKSPNGDDELNLPLMEKFKIVDNMDKDEKKAIYTIIDIAIAKKSMKDNLTAMMKQ